jgi:hypothetical protein
MDPSCGAGVDGVFGCSAPKESGVNEVPEGCAELIGAYYRAGVQHSWEGDAMDRATLKIIDRLLSLVKICPDDVQIELLGIAAEVLDAELGREYASESDRSSAAEWEHAN